MFNPRGGESVEQWQRRIEQWMMQLDVDVKRLWGRVPQTIGQIGGAPINVSLLPSGSSSTSNSDSSSSDGSSSTSVEACPNCVTVTVSGMSGDCDAFNGTQVLSRRSACDNPFVIEYGTADELVEIDGHEYRQTHLGYYAIGELTWYYVRILYGVTGDEPLSLKQMQWTSNTGEGREADTDLSWMIGCGGPLDDAVTVHLSTGGECGSSSSGSSSSGSSSSGGSSSSDTPSSSDGSSSDGSSSDGASSSGGSSSDNGSSSDGGSSDGEPGDSSSSEPTSEASNGDEISGSGGGADVPLCNETACSTWTYFSGNWHQDEFNPGACPTECATSCVQTPAKQGYNGLRCNIYCNGRQRFYEMG